MIALLNGTAATQIVTAKLDNLLWNIGQFITLPTGAVAKYCDKYVCVCLSVREDISRTACAIFA